MNDDLRYGNGSRTDAPGLDGRELQRGYARLTPWVRDGASWFAAALLLAALAAGCAPKRDNAFFITDYRQAGAPRRYHETFDEAYYDRDEGGNVDIVLRREAITATDPRHTITQVIHLNTVWRSIPGATVADASQINATVSYYILTGPVGAAFEGAGSVFVHEDQAAGVLTGSVDQALLQRRRRLAVSHELFQQAQIAGRFRARHDPRRVKRTINDLNRLFSPQP